MFKLMHRKTYSVTARKMTRMLVNAGCAQSKAGGMISQIANLFRVKISHPSRVMDPQTISRIVLEGLIAAKCQVGYEISRTQDGTSNRGNTYKYRHIAMRVPDYHSTNLKVNPSSIPKIRLLGVDCTVEHSADASPEGFTNAVRDTLDIFDRSPAARRLERKVTIREFFRKLKGMNGDHASKEKSCAKGMQNQKQAAALEELGEETLVEKTTYELVQYLAAWNAKKIAGIGGLKNWNSLLDVEKTKHDVKLMEEIIQTLGKEEYHNLDPETCRELDLFIWAGCCMHKNKNSFKSGSTGMIGAWDTLGLTPPILLANKGNTAILRCILNPGGSSGALSDDEQRAFEDSTRGGVKMAALAGAIFNNKDDKKGQGDRHAEYFKEKANIAYTCFPDTSNNRFGSHSDAAAHLIWYLDIYIKFLGVLRLSKKLGTFTQIEQNVLNALNDIPTHTELCAMTLYHQAVCKPYMRAVRNPDVDTQNALDLGPLHVLVQEFVKKIIEEPELLVSPDVSHVEATLDGKEWDSPVTIQAVLKLMPSLPHLKEVTVAFFTGTLATWKHFSAKFAPGGLIDTASASEKQLAWMPPTNVVNEGALGAYLVAILGKPSMTLHQYNALAMFQRNDTQSFVDTVFIDEDHLFVMCEARKPDVSGAERIHRKKIVDFRVEVACIRKEKDIARAEKLKEDAEHLSKVVIITETQQIYRLTVALLGEQIDAI
ncbi:hypothetical protein B0H34DRAFT_667267 [Crassisporium funariophilum]|nr:hypothetical protein B0H34DRAFT_667267 [Crassisporium funariophilum]